MEQHGIYSRIFPQEQDDDQSLEGRQDKTEEKPGAAHGKIRPLSEPATEKSSESPFLPDLFDLVMILVKRRLLIICIVVFSAFMAFHSALNMVNIYRSEATLVPNDNRNNLGSLANGFGAFGGFMAGRLGIGGRGELDKMELVLQSRVLAARMIEKYDLMPTLFPENNEFNYEANEESFFSKIFGSDSDSDKSDEEDEEKPPTIQDGVEKLRNMTRISSNMKKQTVTIAVEHRNPVVARNMVLRYINELSEMLRLEVIQSATENIRFFKNEIAQTEDHLLREKLYTMLANEIETQTFAKAQKHYGFNVIDPPVPSNKRVRPSKKKHLVLSTFVACFLAVFLAFAVEFFARFRKTYPERYGMLVQEFKLNRRKKAD